MSFTASSTMTINAPAEQVWEALTNPELIKRYLYGTEVTTDWKAGSPIVYKGEWEGNAYEDKGVIKEVVPGKRLVSTYWSSMGGREDKPENYQTVAYNLEQKDGNTILTITQDNHETQEAADHTENNWNSVLASIKQIVEA